MSRAEKVVTVGILRPGQTENRFGALREELRRLVDTAGGLVVKEFAQKRARFDPATLIGKGKAAEIGQEIKSLGIRTVIFDDDLTAAQQKNIEKLIPAKIIDRTRLILDIFARRARTREGQIQVELAQLNYLVPRLTGAWRGFSQQVGGIGTRGPGERKIEVERRYVRERIKRLKREIEEVRKGRSRARHSRRSVPIPQIALVGYTNVGKSTLLNALVGKDVVYADDKLFATLDPTTRRVKLPGGRSVLFTDTVGFVQKLPHHLVAAFRATLEEVSEAALLVHLVDASAEDRADQQKTVLDVLQELGAQTLPMITVMSKADRATPSQKEAWRKQGLPFVSAKTGEGVAAMLSQIQNMLEEPLLEVVFDLPHSQRRLIAEIYKTGRIVAERPTEKGTFLRVRIDPANWKRISRQLENGSAR